MTFLNKVGQKIADFFGERTELDSLAENKQFSSDYLEPDYFADLLSYRLFDEQHKIYENKNSLGFVLEVIPLQGANETIQNEISALMREIGEEGASIQCFSWADCRIDRFLDVWAHPRRVKGGIFETIASKKQAFYKKASQNGETPARIFRFFFSYSEPKKKEQNLTQTLDRLRAKKQKCIELFNRHAPSGFCSDLEPLQLLELLSGIINIAKSTGFTSRQSWNRQTWLSKQICNPGTAIEILPQGLLFHDKQDKKLFKTYEVVDYPDQWALGLMSELLGDFFNKSYRIPSPFYIHYGVYFPSQQKCEMAMKGKTKILDHHMKYPTLIRMFPHLHRERQEHLFVQQQLLEGEKIVETRLSCGLWADPSLHSQSESNLIALFQKYGFRLKENHFIHLPDFLSSLPMAWGEDAPYIKSLKRARCFRTSLTSETGSLVPILGEWWGNSSKGMILMGRRGQISAWDPFEAQGNLNTIVIGPSGKGKSVFMQDMISNHLAQGGRAYVLDLGRSFQNLCYLLEGQYLEFSQKSRLNLNPFNFIKTDGDLDTLNNGIELVASIVGTMAMPSHKIDKERADILHAIVKKAWEIKGREASIDDIIELLRKVEFKSELMKGATESLIEGLKRFDTKGTYANYFYGNNLVDFTNDLIVIETEELKNMTDLQTVVLQIFILTISNQIFMGDRERRCMICIDEAWDLLKSPQMQGFIETLARRLRKYNGALVVGTQGLKDFDQSYGAKAAFENANWLVIVGNDNAAINTLKKENIIPMDDYIERSIASLLKEDGKYSEVFIYYKGSGFFSVNQLKLDPFSARLYSTKGNEFLAVQELQKQGQRIEHALDWLATHMEQFTLLMKQGHKVKEAIAFLKTSNP